MFYYVVACSKNKLFLRLALWIVVMVIRVPMIIAILRQIMSAGIHHFMVKSRGAREEYFLVGFTLVTQACVKYSHVMVAAGTLNAREVKIM